MMTFIGVIVVLVGLIAWVGQSFSFIVPSLATKFGLLEPQEEMDETLYIIEAKALSLNDMLLTWTLPLSGVLMLLNNPLWPYFGLIGGGIYLYFSGMIVLSRIYLKSVGKKIGGPSAVTAAYAFSAVWVLVTLMMIIMSISELSR